MDDDEEDEEAEGLEGMDDLIDDGGEELPDAAEMINIRRQM